MRAGVFQNGRRGCRHSFFQGVQAFMAAIAGDILHLIPQKFVKSQSKGAHGIAHKLGDVALTMLPGGG